MRSLSAIQAGASLPAFRPMHAAIANRDNVCFKAVVIGDSVSEGEGVSNHKLRWMNRLQDMMRGGFPTAGVRGGSGYFPVEYTSASLADVPTQDSSQPAGGTPTFTTVDTDGGFGSHSIRLSFGAALIFTGEMTSFRIHYAKGSFGVAFSVEVDGVSFEPSVPTNNGTSVSGFVWDSTSVAAISPGTHTIRIRTSDSAGFISTIHGIEYLYGDENKGIRIYDASRSGAVSTSFGALHFASLTNIGPVHLVITELLTNDAVLYNQTPAQYQTNIGAHIDAVNTAITNEYTHVLFYVSAPNAAVTATYTWADFIVAARAAAGSRAQCVVVDMADWMGATVAGDTLGLWADTVHMSAKGHSLCADRMMRAIDINGGGTSLPVSNSYYPLSFSAVGVLTVRTGKFEIPNDTGGVWTFIKARARVGTAPTGSGIVITVKVDGATAFTISIASGATTGVTTPPPEDVPIGSSVTVDITQVGSSVPGADLSVTLTTQSII